MWTLVLLFRHTSDNRSSIWYNSVYVLFCISVFVSLSDVIWVILSVEVGGLLGVTQQLSSFQAEFNTQPHRTLEGDYNPFASPQKTKCPNSNNNSVHDDSNHKDAGEHWQGPPNQVQPDQNGLSQNSVNITANSLQSNLSVVTYNQVRLINWQRDNHVCLFIYVSACPSPHALQCYSSLCKIILLPNLARPYPVYNLLIFQQKVCMLFKCMFTHSTLIILQLRK